MSYFFQNHLTKVFFRDKLYLHKPTGIEPTKPSRSAFITFGRKEPRPTRKSGFFLFQDLRCRRRNTRERTPQERRHNNVLSLQISAARLVRCLASLSDYSLSTYSALAFTVALATNDTAPPPRALGFWTSLFCLRELFFMENFI